MLMPLAVMWRPVGGMPAHSPRWVPLTLQRNATLSPWARMSWRTLFREDTLQIAKGFIVHGDQLLEAVAAGQLPIRDLVLHVVGTMNSSTVPTLPLPHPSSK